MVVMFAEGDPSQSGCHEIISNHVVAVQLN